MRTGIAGSGSRAARLAGYSVAAGASVASTGSADAFVVYSGEQNIDVALYNAQPLNLNGDAYSDILLKNYVFTGGYYQGAFVSFAPGSLVAFPAGPNNLVYVTALTQGATIDSGTVSGFAAGSMAYQLPGSPPTNQNPNAQFDATTGAFIGLAFPIGGSLPENLHFGWVRVNTDILTGSMTIVDWAYQSQPGVGITAGAVPEPFSLGLLAAGAAGLALLRSQRSEA